MSEKDKSKIGTILWTDLTVDNARDVRDFYCKVIGWFHTPVPMEEYNDYNMIIPATGEPAAGICHKRGGNADFPSQWLNYFSVESLEQSIIQCKNLGGKILIGPKDMPKMGKYCIIEDPAGAVCALFESTN